MRISQDMEDITENRGFCFKETVLTGGPLGETGGLWELLGLRWDTKKDEISIDVKINYGEKKKEFLRRIARI
jgi:hypothetical protein